MNGRREGLCERVGASDAAAKHPLPKPSMIDRAGLVGVVPGGEEGEEGAHGAMGGEEGKEVAHRVTGSA